MPSRKDFSDTADRKKEVLDSFLNTLIDKGVADTSVRDLSASINLQSAGMYYYFQTKEDLVVACAEEAAIRLENNLIVLAINDAKNPTRMLQRLKLRLDEMTPTMKFFTQVCSTPKYEELLQPALNKLTDRYSIYAKKLAGNVGCTQERAEEIMYRCIMTSTQYMVYGENELIKTQMHQIEKELTMIVSEQ